MRTAVRFALVALVLTLVPAGMSLAEPNKERVIVVLEPGAPSVADVALDVARVTGGRIGQVYEHALEGFSMEVPAAAVAALSRNPNVAYVEPDVPVSIAQTGSQPIPTGVDRVEADLNPPAVPMDGIDIAIIDTGVYIGTNPDGTARSHLDLNLKWVTDCTNAMFYPLFGGCAYNGNHQDENGHGTHVAGIAAACDNDIGSLGTAPCATLWSVKVLGADGAGTLGSVLAGIDFVTANAASIEVANMSLTVQGFYQSLNDAITAGVNAGVVFVVAAGNSALDASGFSPASHPDVITVSALADFDGLPGGLGLPTCRPDVDDTLADFSNFGPLVDIAAPGVCIYSTHLNDGYATYSGTSMASPAVAGAVARYLAERSINPNSRADVLAVRNAIVGAAVDQANPDCGFGGDLDSSPEPLLFLNGPLFGGDGACGNGTPPPNNPPTASFTSTCTGLSCAFADTSTDTDGTITGWSWNFGDGTTSAAQDPTHSYATGGTYTVTLTVTDDDGDISTAYSDTVTVSEPAPNTPPVASFTSSCADLVCTFTNTSTDSDGSVVAWSWGFGDGTTSSAQEPTHTYTAGGTYTVTLTVTDNDGATDSANGTVTVTEPPNQVPTASFRSTCTALTCTFTDTSTDDGTVVAWSWSFGDGTTSTAENPTHSYNTGGTYTVTLTVTDNDGATDSTSGTVAVTEPQPATITAAVSQGFLWSDPWAEIHIFPLTSNLETAPGATVRGEWRYPFRNTYKVKAVEGVVDASGFVVFRDRFNKGVPLGFCVNDVVYEGHVYEPSPLGTCTFDWSPASASAQVKE